MDVEIVTTQGTFTVTEWAGTLSTLWTDITTPTPVSCYATGASTALDRLFNSTQVVTLTQTA